MHTQLTCLYQTTLKKYNKCRSRYLKNLESGRFYQFSATKQSQIVKKLYKLKKKLSELHLQLKLGLAAGSLAFTLFTSKPAEAQTLGPFAENIEENPLPPPLPNPYRSVPAPADVDQDGDLDIVLGNKYGSLLYLENIGDNSNIKLVERTGAENPFDGIDVGSNSAPAFIDFDNDGDLDLFIGERDNVVNYYENDEGTFSENVTENPFDGFDFLNGVSFPSPNTRPVVVDFDDDGDPDVFVGSNVYDSGNSTTQLFYFENDGDNNLNEITSPAGPFYQYNLYPAFADVDTDGDFDLFLGTSGGDISFYKNESGSFNLQTGPWNSDDFTGNPMADIGVYTYATPALFDRDGNNVADAAVIGHSYYYYYSNVPIAYAIDTGSFELEERFGLNNPFGGVDIGEFSNPEFC